MWIYAWGIASDVVAKGGAPKPEADAVTRGMTASVVACTLWVVAWELVTVLVVFRYEGASLGGSRSSPHTPRGFVRARERSRRRSDLERHRRRAVDRPRPTVGSHEARAGSSARVDACATAAASCARSARRSSSGRFRIRRACTGRVVVGQQLLEHGVTRGDEARSTPSCAA